MINKNKLNKLLKYIPLFSINQIVYKSNIELIKFNSMFDLIDFKFNMYTIKYYFPIINIIYNSSLCCIYPSFFYEKIEYNHYLYTNKIKKFTSNLTNNDLNNNLLDKLNKSNLLLSIFMYYENQLIINNKLFYYYEYINVINYYICAIIDSIYVLYTFSINILLYIYIFFTNNMVSIIFYKLNNLIK